MNKNCLNPANNMFRQKEGQLVLISNYIQIIVIVLLAAQREGTAQRKNAHKDCLNINVSTLSEPYSYSEPCVKLWKKVDCRGAYVSQSKLGMARSISDCSACKRRNRTGGLFCTGPKHDHKCNKVSLCDGLEASETEDEIEMRNVPVHVQAVDTRNFKVFDPFNRQKEDDPPVSFIVYRRSDPNLGLNAETVEFRTNEKVLIYIHGYANRILDDGTNIKNAAFEGTWDVDSVILVDWRLWSLPLDQINPNHPPDYNIVALANVPVVAEHVRHFLYTYLKNENYIYLVGFSLGAHVAGTAARELAKDGPVVDRISALDPAKPIFESTLNNTYPFNKRSTLRISDATFVDVIHCSADLGMVNPVGHLDTYFKEDQCKLPYCIHRKAIQMYISSLKRCSLITCPLSGVQCSPFTVSAYGYLSDLYPGRGKYAFSINTQYLTWNDEKCSEFMNVYLPAKHRVCFEPPNVQSNCYGYPYLTECETTCSDQKNNTRSVCSIHEKVRLEFEEASQNHARSLKFIPKQGDKIKWHGGNCNR